MDYLIVLIFLSLSALFSGLTLGSFSLNRDDLKRKARLGDKRARKIYELRKNGNLLLCSLLVGNVAVNAALSIFLGSMISGVLAGAAATGLIVIFGEIAPQAIFARYALALGSRFVVVAKVLMFILYPVCWPLSFVLNRVLGNELPTVYTKNELIKLIEDHEDLEESDIDADEERILKGALSFSEKKVSGIMTPRTAIFSLSHDRALDQDALDEISGAGHSRIPVYRETHDEIVGLLYVKDLIRGEWAGKTAGEAARKNLIFVDPDKKLDDLLNDFKKTRQHMFVVMNKFGVVEGIVTIEDVIEEIIGEEIVDEFDKHSDLQALARIRLKSKNLHTI